MMIWKSSQSVSINNNDMSWYCLWSPLAATLNCFWKICLTERKRFYENVSISQGEGECLKIWWPFFGWLGTFFCLQPVQWWYFCLMLSLCAPFWWLKYRNGSFEFTVHENFSFALLRWLWDKPGPQKAENSPSQAFYRPQWGPGHCSGHWMGLPAGYHQVLHHAPGNKLVASRLLSYKLLSDAHQDFLAKT